MDMPPGGALAELLARLTSASGDAVEVRGDELPGWPLDEVAALKSHGVLAAGKPAVSTVCPGCERACSMEVQVVPRAGRAVSLFVVCDKPVDIGRVAIGPAALERWRATAQGLADALARLIGSAGATGPREAGQGFRLGVVVGRKDRAAVYLRFNATGPSVAVAGHELELPLVLSIQQQRLALDLKRLARCVDAPIGGVQESRETPNARRTRVTERVAQEKSKGTRAFLKVVAAEEGLSTSRLKQLIAVPTPPVAEWAAPLLTRSPTGSKTGSRKR